MAGIYNKVHKRSLEAVLIYYSFAASVRKRNGQPTGPRRLSKQVCFTGKYFA